MPIRFRLPWVFEPKPADKKPAPEPIMVHEVIEVENGKWAQAWHCHCGHLHELYRYSYSWESGGNSGYRSTVCERIPPPDGSTLCPECGCVGRYSFQIHRSVYTRTYRVERFEDGTSSKVLMGCKITQEPHEGCPHGEIEK